MFGIIDPVIWIGYVLTILSVIACIVFSVKNWNKGADTVSEEPDKNLEWEKKENELNELI